MERRQNAAHRAQGARQHERQHHYRAGVDADQLGSQPVVRCCQHRLALPRAARKTSPARQSPAHRPTPTTHRLCGNSAWRPRCAAAFRPRRPVAHACPLPSVTCTRPRITSESADGDDDQRHGARLTRRPDGQLVDQKPDHPGCHRHREHDGERKRKAQRGQCHRQHAAQHDELALGEVDHAAGVVDDGKSQCRQRVDGAGGQPGKKKLHKLREHSGLTAPGSSCRF